MIVSTDTSLLLSNFIQFLLVEKVSANTAAKLLLLFKLLDDIIMIYASISTAYIRVGIIEHAIQTVSKYKHSPILQCTATSIVYNILLLSPISAAVVVESQGISVFLTLLEMPQRNLSATCLSCQSRFYIIGVWSVT